jgi:hypothetical protein
MPEVSQGATHKGYSSLNRGDGECREAIAPYPGSVRVSLTDNINISLFFCWGGVA